jgi:4-aminobutyrate aminotransferase-like enzyme
MIELPKLITEVPGPTSRALAKKLKKFEAPTVTYVSEHWPVFWDRAEGFHIWDVDGNRYVDLTSAFGVASLGHSHPKIIQAVHKQSQTLSHAMGDVHPTLLKAELCARLSAATFERWSEGKEHGQTILCNSGFEAVEAAIKTAKLFTGKRGVIAFQGAYHGLGYGALEATWRKDFRTPFIDQLGHFVEFVPFPRRRSGGDDVQKKADLDALEKMIRNLLQQREIGAILVEPFQGRGGEVIPPAGFLSMLRRVCTRARILLIVDEIYVGFWRTGKFFAVEHEDVIPDLICLGKALSGCLPLSACVGRSDIMVAWPESKGEALHTSTFLGNPLACAASLASLGEFESQGAKWKILEKGKKLLEKLSTALQKRPEIREIRGMGLLVGVEFSAEASVKPTELCERLLKRGILALPSGSHGEVLALTPPLEISNDVLDWCVEMIAEGLN